jgi:hypothetical protein
VVFLINAIPMLVIESTDFRRFALLGEIDEIRAFLLHRHVSRAIMI